MRQLVLLNLVLWLAVAATAGAVGFILWDRAQYVRTNQAQVGADLVVIGSPATGRLTQWSVKTGDRVSAGMVLGMVQPLPSWPSTPGHGPVPDRSPAAASGPAPGPVVGKSLVSAVIDAPVQAAVRFNATRGRNASRNAVRTRTRPRPIQAPSRPDPPRTAPPSPSPAPVMPPPVALTSPIDGVVLYTAAIPGTIWSSGRKLAVLADLSKPFVTAYMDDRTVKYLAVGKDVDVYLDAYPGTSFPGRVVRIADAAGSFAAPELPSVAGTNQTRPVERVPVRIAVDNFFGKYVVPGMNATVRIHK